MLRAIYEWCNDSGYTPYLAVKVDASTTVPMEYVKKGEIVLNISFGATSGLTMDHDSVRFHARFGGVSREIYVPINNVMAIYANENGQGMAFEPSAAEAPEGVASRPVAAAPGPVLASVPSAAQPKAQQETPDDHDEPPRKTGRPALTRVK